MIKRSKNCISLIKTLKLLEFTGAIADDADDLKCSKKYINLPNLLVKMDSTDLIGFTAALLTSISFVPQVLKTWRTKHTEDISLLMYILLVTGIFLWLVYGFYLDSMPVILANGVTLVLSMTILVLKMKNG